MRYTYLGDKWTDPELKGKQFDPILRNDKCVRKGSKMLVTDGTKTYVVIARLLRKKMKDKDLKIRYTLGHGPGGQHRNKTETCVVVTHIPTGLKVTCQETRSKNRNLVIAKQLLQEKIERQEKEHLQELKNSERKERINTQQVIRTYNYQRNEVYDHRTKNRADLKKFMKGEIDL